MAARVYELPIPYEALAEFCRENHISSLAVFGSAARGELTPESDIDLLVEFDSKAEISLFTLVELQARLSEMLGRPVDLGMPVTLKAPIREQVLQSAITIYAN